MKTNHDIVETVLTALCLQQIGAVTVRSWYYKDAMSSPHNAAYTTLVERVSGFPRIELNIARQKAQLLLSECIRSNIWCISLYDKSYPDLLRSIKDAPVVLFGKGNMDVLQRSYVAVVGTRRPSFLGRLFARDFVQFLCSHSIGVASGLALGVDSKAHESCLEYNGHTVAVLAGGVNKVSPHSNVSLANQIIERGGAVISEHLPDAIARKSEFVRRNRIISGLSIASVLVESGVEGGSIHQARFTAQQRRPLFAFTPDMTWPHIEFFSRAGAEYLVSELGATKIESRRDYARVLMALQTGKHLPSHDSGQHLLF